MSSETLRTAYKNKQDEFYTMLIDIEKELPYYKHFLTNKNIYCPCDTAESNFWKFLVSVQNEWAIQSVTITHPSSNIVTVSINDHTIERYIKDCGTFQSNDCTKILGWSDVVITNPPFSFFRSFIEWLGDKPFLILGN